MLENPRLCTIFCFRWNTMHELCNWNGLLVNLSFRAKQLFCFVYVHGKIKKTKKTNKDLFQVSKPSILQSVLKLCSVHIISSSYGFLSNLQPRNNYRLSYEYDRNSGLGIYTTSDIWKFSKKCERVFKYYV